MNAVKTGDIIEYIVKMIQTARDAIYGRTSNTTATLMGRR